MDSAQKQNAQLAEWHVSRGGTTGDQNAALQLHRSDKQQFDLAQRELVMRQALTDFTHLAYHTTGVSMSELFDRNAAQLALGSTAALISSALRRRAAAHPEVG